MNSVTVDELVMRISVELDKFKSDASQAEAIDKKLRDTLKDTEGAARDTGKGFDKLGDDVSGASKELSINVSALFAAAKNATKFLGALVGSNAIERFVTGISNANDQLGFLSKRLGQTAREIKGMETAVSALGGSGASAEATLRGLNQGIQEMALMGNDALIPFFGALGVGVVDSTGKMRDMNDILLDMSDSLSKMDPRQAYAFATAMGLDDGVANALIQGRDAMQEMLNLQKQVYTSSTEEIAASRELAKSQAIMAAEWEGLRTLLANALTPALTFVTKVVTGFVDYLNRNARSVRHFFEGAAVAISILLIPALYSATAAVLAMIAPFIAAAAPVIALAAAFGLLYDDYKTWAEGGNSLFDWSKFDGYIKSTDVSVDSLAKGFARLLTGYDSLSDAQEAFMSWLRDTGIIDEHGLSIRGLGNAFKQLGQDVLGAIPALQTMLKLADAVMSGRWADAFALAKEIPAQMAGTLVDAGGAMLGHVAGAVDTMTGHEQEADGTISGGIKSGAAWLKNQLAGWVGDGSEGERRGEAGLSSDKARTLSRVAAEIGMEPNDLAQIISFETGGTFNTNARNPNSSATGLIQKMKDPDGKYYGHTRDELGSMTFDEQMEKVVKRYFQDRGFSDGKLHTLSEGYQAVTGSGYKKGSQAYELNKVWDANGDGVIDKEEAVQAPQFKAHAKDYVGPYQAAQMASNQTFNSVDSRTMNSTAGASVSIGSMTVQTSATTLPAAAKEGVEAGVSRGSELLNQLGGGM